MFKVLVIAALLALLLLLVYSKLYPYFQLLKKILGVAKSVIEPQPGSRRNVAKGESKLVRCIGCGTWIPAERAIGAAMGTSIYCSSKCLEKKSAEKERKLAG